MQRKILHDHPNTKERIYCDGIYVYKQSKRGISDKIKKEANFYENISRMPPEIRNVFPRYYGVHEYFGKNEIKVEYLEGYINLSKLLLEEGSFCNKEEVIGRIVREIISWYGGKYVVIRPDIFDQLYTKRLETRISQLVSHSDDFNRLFTNPIEINGEERCSLESLVKTITNSNFFQEMRKESVSSFFHGDLHYENILVNVEGDIKFVDPNGSLFGLLSYDYGKILHSSFAKYNVIQEYRYSLEKSGDMCYNFHIHETNEFRDFSIILEGELKKYLGEYKYKSAVVACFIHMVSLIIHHKNNSKQQAVALLLQAVLIGEKCSKIISN